MNEILLKTGISQQQLTTEYYTEMIKKHAKS